MKRWIPVVLLTASCPGPAMAASDVFVYPAQGQTQDQQTLDQAQCQQFATQQTGFDPMAMPTASAPAPQQRGGVIGGAIGGALFGTAIGAIAGDAGKGAEIGAASGGLMGGMRRAESRNQQQQWAQQQEQAYMTNRANYMRAYSACLEGRGYTVR